VALLAWGFTTLVALVRREQWSRRAVIGFLATALGSVGVYFAYISGSAGGGGLELGSLLNKASSVQGLNPLESQLGVLLGTMILVVAVAPRWAGVIWLVSQQRTRWNALTTYSLGLIIGAVVTLILISGGLNDTWFALAASAPLSVASAVGIGYALESYATGSRVPREIAAAVVGALLLTGVVVLLWMFGPSSQPSLRWVAPISAVAGALALAALITRWPPRTTDSLRGASSTHHPSFMVVTLTILVLTAACGRILSLAASDFGVQPETGFNATEFSPDEKFIASIDQYPTMDVGELTLAAASWVRLNTNHDDLFATNATFGFIVPALTARQTFISGIAYQAPYSRPSALPEIPPREADSRGFTDSPSSSNARALCEAGVDFLWVDPERAPAEDWEPFATAVFSNESAVILQMNDDVCSRR
jgi:hypothetical protein